MKQIFAQAPVARMQAKRGILGDNFTQNIGPKIDIERKIFNAAAATSDYTQNNPFMSHSEFKEKYYKILSPLIQIASNSGFEFWNNTLYE